ncbi:ATP-binding protein [Neiella marina]|uniref:ATP-binding protein n=1 Tax=Neiella holothuriorum TaxID=2870530 RepID=A0ABS7EHI6_9GAMM|nr:ATP-binding protein [Neiella holothuriorum]MBW8191814.1 ATP-binding protein [Neiella holothuriorum]
MNTFYEELIKDRNEYAGWLEKKPALRRIVEDLYPDKAHFIYELLQNAEDAEATEVSFQLLPDELMYEHNGRPFNQSDIDAITDIGESSKRDDEDTIGRFGIGFKAVFVYTESPKIHSGNVNFSIERFVVPNFHSFDESFDSTKFYFPFNSQKKSPEESFSDIRKALNLLNDTSLLFLKNIKSIRWEISGQQGHCLERIHHTNEHIEIVSRTNAKDESKHWLRFLKPITDSSSLYSSVAFALKQRKSHKSNDGTTTQLSDRFEIEPVNGSVSAFFPAEKESSGLYFNIHAPFVTELSRASVKDTRENAKLYESIAELCCEALKEIKELGLLNSNFLAVLPNNDDRIPERYNIIRSLLLDCMSTGPYVPTFNKEFAPGRQLLQSKSSFHRVFSMEDMSLFLGDDIYISSWSVVANQKNGRIDKFLKSVGVKDWSKQELSDALTYYSESSFFGNSKRANKLEHIEFNNWISVKPAVWLRDFYALLYSELEDELAHEIAAVKLIKTSSDKFAQAENCYYPTVGKHHNTSHLFVHSGLLKKYDNEPKSCDERVRKFFETIGIQTFGESEEIHGLLERYYRHERASVSFETHIQHLKRFIEFTKRERYSSSVLSKYRIAQNSEFDYVIPAEVYLSPPYTSRRMDLVYDALNSDRFHPLSNLYSSSDIPDQELAKFFQGLGAKSSLEIVEITCSQNPKWTNLRKQAPGAIHTGSGINRDYTIDGIERLLAAKSKDIANMVLDLMRSRRFGSYALEARYSRNQSNYAVAVPSLLIHHLSTKAWVPLTNGQFARPCDSKKSFLPTNFKSELKSEWARKVEFCKYELESAHAHEEKVEAAKTLGLPISSPDDLAHLSDFLSIPKSERDAFFDSRRATPELTNYLPNKVSGNPERRALKVQSELTNAPLKQTTIRERSVSVGTSSEQAEAKQYLLAQYSEAGSTICQVCQCELPFKKSDGEFYFEAAAFVGEADKHYYQNNLCLCPNHAAMFKHALHDRLGLLDSLLTMRGNEIEVVLAGEQCSIYFTTDHANDLRAIFGRDPATYIDKEQTPVTSSSAGSHSKSIEQSGDDVISDLTFDGVLIPAGLRNWKNPYATVSATGDKVSLGTKHKLIATFPSLDEAKSWWKRYSTSYGLSGGKFRITKLDSKPHQAAPKQFNTQVAKTNLSAQPSYGSNKEVSKAKTKIPPGKKYCPKCEGVQQKPPCRHCFGTGWV